jgi:DNA-binding GntR family transcriptional regulator
MADIERLFARGNEEGSPDPFGLMPPLERVSLARRAEELIRQAIVSGLLRSGEQISPQEIADRLGVSRTPVREALIHLNAVGLVEMLPGRFQIASPTALAIRDAFMLREALEGMAARLAAERRTADEAKTIVQHAQLSRQAAQEKDRARFQKSDRAFHLAIGEASHSVQIARYLSYALDLALTLRNLRIANTPFKAGSVRHHVELAAAIERGDADAAEKISRDHVRAVLAWVTDARPADTGG